MGSKTLKRNGSVELIRFVFCLIVLLCHITKDLYGTGHYGDGYFWRGQISVELFLIISGYFMCRSAHRTLENHQGTSCISLRDILKESKDFLVRKIGPIWFYHIVFNAFCLIYCAITRDESFDIILSKVPSFFFLPVLGFSDGIWLMGAEWYIGYMLFVMAIIYPILIRWFNTVSKYIAPVLGVCLYGYLMIRYQSVVGTVRMVRAFGGILLGVASFHGVRKIHSLIPEKRITVISFLSFAVFLGFVFYMGTNLTTRAVEPLFVILIWFALTVTFSERGLLSSTKILNNPFVLWLGKISLPIYMIQNITRRLVPDFGGGISLNRRLALTVGVTVICGILMYYACVLKERIRKSGYGKNAKTALVFLFSVLLISTSVVWGLCQKNQYEQPDAYLAEANEFRIVYHETDGSKAADQTTIVVCGTPTRTLTTEELGFHQDGREFLGWKAYRPDTRLWRIKNSDGEKKWRRWFGTDETPSLYKNGCKVKNTVKPGYSVHFYAQWAPK